MFFDHMEEIEKLIKMVSESDLSEFTVEEDEMEIIIRKVPHCKKKEGMEQPFAMMPQVPGRFGFDSMPPFGVNAMPQAYGTAPAMPQGFGMPPVQAMPQVPQGYTGYAAVMKNEASISSASPANGVPMAAAMQNDEMNIDGNKVTSPLVGTFYASSSPDKDPFVKKGDMVKKGQVLGIVEAMKLMNEIECEYDGVVVDILVQNGDMVEYGQPLFIIK